MVLSAILESSYCNSQGLIVASYNAKTYPCAQGRLLLLNLRWQHRVHANLNRWPYPRNGRLYQPPQRITIRTNTVWTDGWLQVLQNGNSFNFFSENWQLALLYMVYFSVFSNTVHQHIALLPWLMTVAKSPTKHLSWRCVLSLRVQSTISTTSCVPDGWGSQKNRRSRCEEYSATQQEGKSAPSRTSTMFSDELCFFFLVTLSLKMKRRIDQPISFSELATEKMWMDQLKLSLVNLSLLAILQSADHYTSSSDNYNAQV